MHPRTTHQLVATLALALALPVSGCTGEQVSSALQGLAPGAAVKTAVREQEAAEGRTAAPRTYHVVVDTSGSTLRDRRLYLRAIEAVLKQMTWGDRLLISEVARDSVANGSFLLETELPAFEPDLPAEPASENEFDIAAWKQERTTKRAQQWEAFLDQHDIDALRTTALHRAERTLLARKTGASDILGAAEVAARVSNRSKHPTAVIFLSDALIKANGVDFYADRLTAHRIDVTLDSISRRSAFPDFGGAPAYWIGARETKANDVAAVRAFWLRYAEQANLDLDEDNLVGRPSFILFAEWLEAIGTEDSGPTGEVIPVANQ